MGGQTSMDHAHARGALEQETKALRDRIASLERRLDEIERWVSSQLEAATRGRSQEGQ